MLAVVVQEVVLAQYEAVCEAAGLIPQEVDISSLRMFNLWAQGAGRTVQSTADYLWVNATDGGVTAFIFHKGTLVFLRSKLQGGVGSGSAWGASAGQVGLDRIVQECADSIYACQQQTPDLAIDHAVLIADDAMGSGLQQLLEKGLGVPVQAVEWDRVQQSGGGPIVGPHTSAALPADVYKRQGVGGAVWPSTRPADGVSGRLRILSHHFGQADAEASVCAGQRGEWGADDCDRRSSEPPGAR